MYHCLCVVLSLICLCVCVACNRLTQHEPACSHLHYQSPNSVPSSSGLNQSDGSTCSGWKNKSRKMVSVTHTVSVRERESCCWLMNINKAEWMTAVSAVDPDVSQSQILNKPRSLNPVESSIVQIWLSFMWFLIPRLNSSSFWSLRLWFQYSLAQSYLFLSSCCLVLSVKPHLFPAALDSCSVLLPPAGQDE